jgi:hypothetical protein
LGVSGNRNERLVNLCKQLRATRYLSGAAAKEYLEVPLYEKEGIEVEFQDFHHPTYPQLHGEFIPFLSIIDLLFNVGPDSHQYLTDRGSH